MTTILQIVEVNPLRRAATGLRADVCPVAIAIAIVEPHVGFNARKKRFVPSETILPSNRRHTFKRSGVERAEPPDMRIGKSAPAAVQSRHTAGVIGLIEDVREVRRRCRPRIKRNFRRRRRYVRRGIEVANFAKVVFFPDVARSDVDVVELVGANVSAKGAQGLGSVLVVFRLRLDDPIDLTRL